MTIAFYPFANHVDLGESLLLGLAVDKHYVVLNRFTADMDPIHREVWVGVTDRQAAKNG